ncbi:MAG: metallophosphoesterase [Prevotella sp.]|jgi:predicted MPP superfamily phosphohydrolase|nr:metallophosphoesterase [Prevotella sp.]
MPSSLLFILLQPDTYIYIGWGTLALLSIILGLICWRTHRRWLRWTLVLTLFLCWHIFLWGTYVGFRKIEVVHIEYASRDLPKAFDGYRIVQFSDVHAGTYTGSRRCILQAVVDSINAQHADLVVFTGDIQNKEASELIACQDILRKIKAPDGVISILGNHDYPMYIDTTALDPYERSLCLGRTVSAEQDMGWKVLMNGHLNIQRGTAHIVIAGMENDGEGRFPKKGDINNTLRGVCRDEFVVMLEHDPTSWRNRILPHSHAQLTLSGHTHGGQLSLFGLSPAIFKYKESSGMYWLNERALYVSRGVGGVVPFRFGATPEISVITLKTSTLQP